VGSKNHIFDGGPLPPGKGHFSEKEAAHCKVQGLSAVSCVKTAVPIEMPSGMLSWVDQGNHILDGSPDPPLEGAILRGNGMP